VRQDIREHKGWIWVGAGVIAVGLYGVVATFQPDDSFGRVLFAGQFAWAC
jgi:small multidrug resistance family-3 protein